MPLSSVPLPFSSSRQLSVAAKPNDSLLLALSWFILLWSLSFLPGHLAFGILFLYVKISLSSGSSSSSRKWLFSFLVYGQLHLFFGQMPFCSIAVTAIHVVCSDGPGLGFGSSCAGWGRFHQTSFNKTPCLFWLSSVHLRLSGSRFCILKVAKSSSGIPKAELSIDLD